MKIKTFSIGVVVNNPVTSTADDAKLENKVLTITGRKSPFVNKISTVVSAAGRLQGIVNDLSFSMPIGSVNSVIIIANEKDKLSITTKIPTQKILTPISTVPPTPTPQPIQQAFITSTNAFRANPASVIKALGYDLNEGLPPNTLNNTPKQKVTLQSQLQAAAQKHATWMAANGVIGHAGANGSTPQQRAAAEGYASGVGENCGMIAATGLNESQAAALIDEFYRGYVTDEDVTGRGHRINMLIPSWKNIGVAYAFGKYQGIPAIFNCVLFGA